MSCEVGLGGGAELTCDAESKPKEGGSAVADPTFDAESRKSQSRWGGELGVGERVADPTFAAKSKST